MSANPGPQDWQRDADILRVSAPGVKFHVLRDADGLYLIDAGFLRARQALDAALRERGWRHEPIRGIIVTHGHLDHILNVGPLAEETGAWIAAPRLDAGHYAGRPPYHGWSRLTGVLEAIGRRAFSFRPFVPDRLLDDGDFIDVWHGLRAVHLPGHTPGHMGFLCEKLGLLFCGDLFASYGGFAHFPPRIFNSDDEQIPASIDAALALDLRGVIPNHGDRSPPEEHLRRLRRLHRL